MALSPRTRRLFDPPADAAHTAQAVHIPAPPMAIPEPALQRFKLTPQQVAALRRSAAAPQVPADWLVPRRWTGAVALVICGAGDTRRIFKAILFERLLAEGIACLTYDPPGHGELQYVPMTLGNARLAASAALDWVCAQPEVRAVGAVGISLGGSQALDLAARDPRVAAVVSISTPVSLAPVTRWTVLRELLALMTPPNLTWLRYPSPAYALGEWRGAKGIWLAEPLPELIAQFDVCAAVRATGARPKLFIHGAWDRPVPLSNAQQLYDAAQPERALLVVPHASHTSVVLDERTMQAMAHWLAERLGAAYRTPCC
ncbi:MAG: alpha/beta hydrolase [Anaerolineae bacterium]|nr:alpha/beta hydrolase [Thermoflexales bacterium]MDW8395399.1 alpha/beta hydrolase [Anaerolineae bacterium]